MKSSLEPSNPFAKTAGAMSGVSRFLSKRDKGHRHHALSRDTTNAKEVQDVSLKLYKPLRRIHVLDPTAVSAQSHMLERNVSRMPY